MADPDERPFLTVPTGRGGRPNRIRTISVDPSADEVADGRHDDRVQRSMVGRLGMTRLHELAVADLMTIDPIVIEVDAPIETAEELVASHGISGLPVVDAQGHLVGVISQSDLLALSGRLGALVRRRASGLRAGELMSSPVITVPLGERVVEAARRMRDERIHRLVVVDEAGRPIGVLAASDYVSLVADYWNREGASDVP